MTRAEIPTKGIQPLIIPITFLMPQWHYRNVKSVNAPQYISAHSLYSFRR